jgi:hypothetical protein
VTEPVGMGSIHKYCVDGQYTPTVHTIDLVQYPTPGRLLNLRRMWAVPAAKSSSLQCLVLVLVCTNSISISGLDPNKDSVKSFFNMYLTPAARK